MYKLCLVCTVVIRKNPDHTPRLVVFVQLNNLPAAEVGTFLYFLQRVKTSIYGEACAAVTYVITIIIVTRTVHCGSGGGDAGHGIHFVRVCSLNWPATHSQYATARTHVDYSYCYYCYYYYFILNPYWLAVQLAII